MRQKLYKVMMPYSLKRQVHALPLQVTSSKDYIQSTVEQIDSHEVSFTLLR